MAYVIQVDKTDQFLGVMEKMEAHEKGVLHRAVSVLIFNSNGDMLLQRRAFDKYHSGGLWSNAACTHPSPGETTLQASDRRLKEEMGISANLSHLYSFIYKVQLDNNLTEHELDHVFVGVTDEVPILNPEEAMSYKYISIQEIQEDLKNYGDRYSAWFKMIFARLLELKPELIAA